jgi:hypothetical protein
MVDKPTGADSAITIGSDNIQTINSASTPEKEGETWVRIVWKKEIADLGVNVDIRVTISQTGPKLRRVSYSVPSPQLQLPEGRSGSVIVGMVEPMP